MLLTSHNSCAPDADSEEPCRYRPEFTETFWWQTRQERTCVAWEAVTTYSPSSGIEAKGTEKEKIVWPHTSRADILDVTDTHLRINTHVGTYTGTVLHLDVCRWELRCHCALSKESLTCCVNGAGRGRLAINLLKIEPLTAALTLTTWPDSWRPANYLHK